MRVLAVLLLITSVFSANAKTPAEMAGDIVRQVAKGGQITVNDYDEKTKAFLITINSEPGVGPNYAEPEDLRKAIEFEGTMASFIKSKDQMRGSVYQLKKSLRLITENEMLKRLGGKSK